MSKSNLGSNRSISIFNIIILMFIAGALYVSPFLVEEKHLDIFLASFFGAFGGGYALYAMDCIRRFRSDYDEINYTISLISIHTENTIGFYKSFLEPRKKALEDMRKDIESAESARKFLRNLPKKILIPDSAINRAKNQIKKGQKLSHLQIFYLKPLMSDMNDDVNSNKLRFTMYKNPNLIMVLTKLSQNLRHFNVCKNDIIDFIEKESGGKNTIETKMTSIGEVDIKLKQLEEQNNNLEKSLNYILYFGETLGMRLLENYIKHYSWLTRKFLRTMGSGYKITSYMCRDEYKKYIPEPNYIDGYENVLLRNNKWNIHF